MNDETSEKKAAPQASSSTPPPLPSSKPTQTGPKQIFGVILLVLGGLFSAIQAAHLVMGMGSPGTVPAMMVGILVVIGGLALATQRKNPNKTEKAAGLRESAQTPQETPPLQPPSQRTPPIQPTPAPENTPEIEFKKGMKIVHKDGEWAIIINVAERVQIDGWHSANGNKFEPQDAMQQGWLTFIARRFVEKGEWKLIEGQFGPQVPKAEEKRFVSFQDLSEQERKQMYLEFDGIQTEAILEATISLNLDDNAILDYACDKAGKHIMRRYGLNFTELKSLVQEGSRKWNPLRGV